MFGRRRKKSQKSAPDVDPAEMYAQARELRKDYRNADQVEALLRRAGELGHKVASCDLGVFLEGQHRYDEARQWFEKARDQGHQLAARMLANLDEKQAASTADREMRRLETAATDGDPEAMLGLGRRLLGLNRRTDAANWISRAATAGHRPAVRELAQLRARDGELDEAEALLRQDAGHDDIDGVRALAEFLRRYHRGAEELQPVLERLVQLGDSWAAIHLARLHTQASDVDEAQRWYRAALGNAETAATASAELGALLLDQGDATEAEQFLRRSKGLGDFHLAWLLESRGDDAAAEPLYRNLAESDIDQVDAAAGLARVLERRGAIEEARQWRDHAEVDGQLPPGPQGRI